MRLISLPAFLIVAGGGGIGLSAGMYLMNKQRESFAQQSAFLKKAISTMNEQPKVAELLGEPFQIGQGTFMDGWSRLKPNEAQIRVPIKGENDKAYLYAYAKKAQEPGGKFRLTRVEMTFDKVQGKKLILLDREQEDVPSSIGTINSSPAGNKAETKDAKSGTRDDKKNNNNKSSHQ